MMANYLSRPEELVLIAVWRLGEEAYCVPIRRIIEEISGKESSFGAVYVPLHRLEKKGLVRSHMGGPEKIRGGRSKRFYTLTKSGSKALAEVKRLHEAMWAGMPEPKGSDI